MGERRSELMRELIGILIVIAVIAIIWYLRKQSAQAAEQRKVDEFRQLQAKAAEADRAERASLAAAAAPAAAAGVDQPSPVDRGRNYLETMADTASGEQYERAADQMERMTADLERSRQDADRAAQRLTGEADAALGSIQAAAAAHGGAVPGDGTHNCPSSYPIKGVTASMHYYQSRQPMFDQTIPDVCFQSAAAAEAAGFADAGADMGARGGVAVEEVVAEEVVAEPGGEPLQAVVAEAILIRDRDDAERGDIVAEAIAAADAGGVPPGAVRGDGSRECPLAYPIKGNQSSMLYHEPGSQTYAATIPEFCFSSAASAEAAGFAATRR
jgi:hypothetical protein